VFGWILSDFFDLSFPEFLDFVHIFWKYYPDFSVIIHISWILSEFLGYIDGIYGFYPNSGEILSKFWVFIRILTVNYPDLIFLSGFWSF
jgi:hypothetical protein